MGHLALPPRHGCAEEARRDGLDAVVALAGSDALPAWGWL